MLRAPPVDGTVHPTFEKVRKTFVNNFRFRGEIGASLCVIRDGEVVVDLWGGWADKSASRPWQSDTLSTIFSATKGVAATCLLMLHDRGLLDYDKPVAHYWPEFAQGGKADITVRTLLNHRSGLCAIDAEIGLDGLEDPKTMAAAAEIQRPLWEPGTAQGYHGISYGFYVAELFRRIAGESLGEFLRREVTTPLDAEVHIGLPAELDHTVATLYPQRPIDVATKIVPRALFSPKVEGRVYRSVASGGLSARAFAKPAALGVKGMANFNTTRVHRMELLWANGLGNGRGLARIYQALALGGSFGEVMLMKPATARLPRARGSWETDRVLQKPMGFTLGFVKEQPELFSPNISSFGHPGAGGPLGWADPEERLSIGYVMNRMDYHIRSKRALALCHAIYDCLG